MPAARSLRLAAIGTAGGLVSGLFGVGGGSVIVPLLILWLGYGEREATGTSLAAIVPTAAIGMAAQALYGNVRLEQGLVIAIPALAGVVLGAYLQQKVPGRTVSLLFAGLLVVVAVELVAQ
ncbi:MAG: sulfite exporter TauE/SafE family protein [Solirubrobacteraceae bacterium]